MLDTKYRDYFEVDERYFPCIDDAAINAGAPWMNTYPHSTFISMLIEMERALARQNNGKSLWIEGAYGTGKSQCAYALKKILELPPEVLREYWEKFDALKNKKDLLGKIIGHKERGIVTAYRYASGSINSPRDLFMAIQETLKSALGAKGLYAGEDTLKDSVIAWIDDPIRKQFLDALLAKPEYAAMFSQSNADEILTALRRGGEVKMLMDNLFKLADKEGITALSIDADRLITWITDVIDKNDVKIVFIWDEFSDYFKKNKESLSELQKIVALVQAKPFYLVLVTHEAGQLFSVADDTWTKIRDRFERVVIDLPPNIAIDLIGHAFNEVEAAKEAWSEIADDFNERVHNSRNRVMQSAKISDPNAIKKIIPLHPMAALILKNIAHAFKSNQRSMFDFIKSANDEKAFQWFIDNTGPFDDHPLLTVDMLWNFFYEKGKENLTPDIRLILDTFPQQSNLTELEKSVLKAILIMQAIDQRTGGSIDLFKATDQNLSYVFEGISELDNNRAASIAKGLKDKGILITSPVNGGGHAYATAKLRGDDSKIEEHKKELRKSTTAKLVQEGDLATVLSLPPALRLRFESETGTGKITPVTFLDFTRTINTLRNKSDRTGWNFHAVIAFAKDEDEMSALRKNIKAAVSDKNYENIIFIDALSTSLGVEKFEEYVDYAAMALYYQGNQNQQARENSEKARRVLDQDWRNRIYNGTFVVYTHTNQGGEKCGNAQGVANILQSIVVNRFPLAGSIDFVKGLTENQFKLTQTKASAKAGIMQQTSGVVVGIEKHLLPAVWQTAEYWKNPPTSSLSISIIKTAVEKQVNEAFEKEGNVSIEDLYNFLEEKYGFAPSNISAFLAGFLIKEYAQDPYRYTDSASAGGHEQMSPDKLAEMLGNYIGSIGKPTKPKATYIVKMTAEEKAFYELTEKAWQLPPNSCSSPLGAANAVMKKMRDFSLPVWCLEEVDDAGVYDVVQKYIELVQREGKEAHRKVMEIGAAYAKRPTIGDNMFALLTSENCRKGMHEFLHTFEEGKVLELARTIGAENNVIADIRHLFSSDRQFHIWNRKTGEDEIRKLISEYSVTKKTNEILNTSAQSYSAALKEWRESLRFIGISWEALSAKYPALVKIIATLLKISKNEDMLPEQIKVFSEQLSTHSTEIKNLFNSDKIVFSEVYAPYLQGIGDNDISTLKSNLGAGIFILSRTESNARVKQAAEEFLRNQLKTQLFAFWREKTQTKNPSEWSSRYRTPILACVPIDEYEKAERAFETLNRNWGKDNEINEALAYLKSTPLFDIISDETKRDEAFRRFILGKHAVLLADTNRVRDALERFSVDTYAWSKSPGIKRKIEELAKNEYDSGGSDKVLAKIDEMDDAELKSYLKRLVKDSPDVGIEILSKEGEADNVH
jgi:hypothetical protein